VHHKQLTNHIKGSVLKEQFLEAFLVQSAYIESLLKLYARFIIYTTTKGESHTNKVLKVITGDIERYGLHDLLRFLYKTESISKDEHALLDKYRNQRNRVLHDLVAEIRKDTFDKELEVICTLGTTIIEDKKFKEMASIVEEVEKAIEDAKHKAQDKSTSPHNGISATEVKQKSDVTDPIQPKQPES
jgi:hypothetical protein